MRQKVKKSVSILPEGEEKIILEILNFKSYTLFSDLDAKSPSNNDWFITYIATVGF